ncbi:MAG: hypothetical protein KDE58_17910, partial [Caldilineaceae bacterium]|nr:hypothetical protein [Caldilineaceae bacterium]
MSRFAQEFDQGTEPLAQAREEGSRLVQESEEAAATWLTDRTMLEVGLMPRLRAWLGRFRVATKPFRLWPLDLQRHWLRRYTGVTWWSPTGLRFRFGISVLWLLIQYERLRAWLLMHYRRLRQWVIRHRAVLLAGVLTICSV